MRLQGSGHGLGRRGLLAGAATLIGAGLARLAGAGRAEAGHNTPGSGVADGADSLAVHLGVINTRNATTRTLIRGTVTDNAVFVVDNGTGVGGVSSSDAIFGISSTANAAAIRGVHAN